MKIFKKKFKEKRMYDLLLFFSHIPAKKSMGFQTVESNYFFEKFENCVNVSLRSKKFKPKNNLCVLPSYSKFYFLKLKNFYSKHFSNNKNKFVLIDLNDKYCAKLAYGIFLNNVYTLLPFFEKNNIPFVFTLYPGGGFALNNPISDEMLKSVFSSKFFRKVIVTMPITKDYLLNNKFCNIEQIEYIYGVVPQVFDNVIENDKFYYKKNKNTFDICFVAHKYTTLGEDKGYDVFIKTAKKLIPLTEDIHFHIVGDWKKSLIDISGFESQIHFYGVQNYDFFSEFYKKMDIFISPNRFSKIYQGNFDGFPLGIEAGLSGVYLLVTDPLNMKNNTTFKNFDYLEVIDLDVEQISNSIVEKLNDLDSFYYKSKKLQEKFFEVFDKDSQLQKRLNIVLSEME